MNEGPRRQRTPRQQRAADAAIEVIAEGGLRGLTHRSVDTKAGLPAGSTSSCFRTRLDLQRAVLDRMVELDREMLTHLPVDGWRVETVEQRAAIADLLAGLMDYYLGPARNRTLARLELYLDASRRAELDRELAAANREFLERTAAGMRGAGVDNPTEAARLLLAQLDGLLYDALARPFLGGAERQRTRRALDTIVRGYAPQTSTD